MSTYLGQNFLKNEEIIDFIVEQVDSMEKSIPTIEIWPWKCALTKKLSEKIENLKVFEKDESFFDLLQKCVKKENIIMWDFLSAELKKYIKWDFYNAFWNLPYYITSPIFRKLVNDTSYKYTFESEPKLKSGVFMIQKEVWEKIKTNTSKKSVLWFILNFEYKIEYLKTVPAKDFDPAPKVDSCLVRFDYVWKKISWDFEKLNDFLKLMMMYKKKSLWKIQKILKKQWKTFELTSDLLQKRVHELSWEDIEKIVF